MLLYYGREGVEISVLFIRPSDSDAKFLQLAGENSTKFLQANHVQHMPKGTLKITKKRHNTSLSTVAGLAPHQHVMELLFAGRKYPFFLRNQPPRATLRSQILHQVIVIQQFIEFIEVRDWTINTDEI